MDDREILESVYRIIKQIKSDKSMVEYGDIVTDIEEINEALYINAIRKQVNGFDDIKSLKKLYDELINKYKNKEDWKCSGYYAYHARYNWFCNSNNISQNRSVDYNTLLINLRGWIIRYLAYKICKDKLKEEVEGLFIGDSSIIRSEQELSNTIVTLDGKLLKTFSKYENE